LIDYQVLIISVAFILKSSLLYQIFQHSINIYYPWLLLLKFW